MHKLSPSDFAFLYEDCKLCYWLKVKHGIMPPPSIFPGIFSTINSMVQGQMVGHRLNEFGKDLPNIEVIKQEGYTKSQIIPDTNVYVAGKFDLICKNDDGTHTLVDLKISKPDIDKIDKYKTQLGSYKYALEHPDSGEAIKITKLALLVFYPENARFDDSGAIIELPAKWLEIPIDDDLFVSFIKEVDTLLAGDAPKESETCGLCKYRHLGEEISHHIGNSVINNPDEIPF